MKQGKDNGYIYIIQSAFGCKIGKAINYMSRFSSIQSSCPIPLKLCKVYHINDPESTEKYIHNKLKDKKIKGEWFKLDDNDIKTIKWYIEGQGVLIREVKLISKDDLGNVCLHNMYQLISKNEELKKDNNKLNEKIKEMKNSLSYNGRFIYSC